MEESITTFEDAAMLVDQEVIDKWEHKFPVLVTSAIKAIKVSAIYSIYPDIITDLSKDADPLHGISKADDLLPFIHVEWPMVYFFDYMTEKNRMPPTWDEYWHEMKTTYLDTWFPVADNGKLTSDQIYKAFQWRFGLAWMSWMKELYVLSTLRHIYQVPVQRHIFADVHLKIDMWYNHKALCLTMPSAYFEKKTRPIIPWKFLITDRKGVGVGVWYPDTNKIEEAAKWLKE